MNLDRRKLINFIEIYIFSAKGCLVKTTDAKKEDLQLTLQDECSSASSVVWSAAASNFGKLICPFTSQNISLSSVKYKYSKNGCTFEKKEEQEGFNKSRFHFQEDYS